MLTVKSLSGTKQFGTVTSTGNEVAESIALDSGRYILELASTSKTSVAFDLHLQIDAYASSEEGESPESDVHEGEGELGPLSGLKTVEGLVSDSLSENSYEFSLPRDGVLTWQLSNVTGPATGQLYLDTGLVNKDKPLREIRASATADATDEIPLEHGSYKLRVTTTSSTSVLYRLGLNAEAYEPASPDEDPGSEKDAALDAGELTTLKRYSGFVGSSDLEDYYRFSLERNASVGLSLSNVVGQATGQLFSDVPLIDESKPLRIFQASDNRDAHQMENLQRGVYFVRVIPNGTTNALYLLGLSAETPP